MVYKKQSFSYALIITAAAALHLFAAAAIFLIVRYELRLIENNSAPVSVIHESPGETAAEAFADVRQLFITIDDGPNAETTPLLLDVLSRHGAKAAFFPLAIDGCDDLYRLILSEGHIIGNHTFSHDFKTVFAGSAELFREDVNKAEAFFERLGISPVLFRFPGGGDGRPESIMQPRRDILRDLGLQETGWDVSLGDDSIAFGSAEALAGIALEEILKRGDSVLLLHDGAGHAESAAALNIILTELETRGYIFIALGW